MTEQSTIWVVTRVVYWTDGEMRLPMRAHLNRLDAEENAARACLTDAYPARAKALAYLDAKVRYEIREISLGPVGA